jgi:cytochrome c peroxidase
MMSRGLLALALREGWTMRCIGARLLALVGVIALAAGCAPARDKAGPALDDWTAEQRAVLLSLQRRRLEPRADPSNRHAGSAAAARLGQQLFGDPRFSRNGRVACASCHLPQRQFQDDLPRGIGLSEGSLRTMPLMDAAAGDWFFWDGRKDSLWAQALGPLEDAREHGSNRLQLARLLRRHHRGAYEAVFGTMPALGPSPADASPLGSPAERTAWQALDARTRSAASAIFANMGKAIAAYVATLQYGDSRVDRYIAGLADGAEPAPDLLNESEKAGLRLFIGKGRCVTCHNGPLWTDHHFHNTGVPPLAGDAPAPGRAAAIATVKADAYNCLGPHSDARPEQCEELRFIAERDPHMLGAFKTPSLRNVGLRPPYMHAGQFDSLTRVLAHYAKPPVAALGVSELRAVPPGPLSAAEQAQLISLLQALSGPVVEVAPAAP